VQIHDSACVIRKNSLFASGTWGCRSSSNSWKSYGFVDTHVYMIVCVPVCIATPGFPPFFSLIHSFRHASCFRKRSVVINFTVSPYQCSSKQLKIYQQKEKGPKTLLCAIFIIGEITLQLIVGWTVKSVLKEREREQPTCNSTPPVLLSACHAKHSNLLCICGNLVTTRRFMPRHGLAPALSSAITG
jgi:hypothetical protein